MEILVKILKNHFLDLFDLKEIRPNIFQVIIPYYYPDGDIYEIFISKIADRYLISDYGLTLAKVGYYVDTETDTKVELLNKIIKENQLSLDDGSISVLSDENSLLPNLLVMLDAISKISALSLLTTKRIKNQFYEGLEIFLQEAFKDFGFEKKFIPEKVPYAEDYLSPLAITKTKTQIPICIFPIASNERCDQVTITSQHYLIHNYRPMLVGIYENMENISRKKSSKVTNLLDKQFSFFENNENLIKKYLEERVN